MGIPAGPTGAVGFPWEWEIPVGLGMSNSFTREWEWDSKRHFGIGKEWQCQSSENSRTSLTLILLQAGKGGDSYGGE